MSVETALFFESVEEIYARVFIMLRPLTALPRITVRFRKYASANSRVRLKEDQLAIDISDLLEGAPAPIQEALAIILLSKLFRKTPGQSVVARYRRYFDRAEMRGVLHRTKQERGRKLFRDGQGKYYNLFEVFETLNTEYFAGSMARPELGWSCKPSRTVLGHYDPAHHVIVLSCALDCGNVKPVVVDYVMFHEMLHLRYPTEQRSLRRCIHTPDFKKAEREFRGFDAARAAIRRFVEGLRGDSRH